MSFSSNDLSRVLSKHPEVPGATIAIMEQYNVSDFFFFKGNYSNV